MAAPFRSDEVVKAERVAALEQERANLLEERRALEVEVAPLRPRGAVARGVRSVKLWAAVLVILAGAAYLGWGFGTKVVLARDVEAACGHE